MRDTEVFITPGPKDKEPWVDLPDGKRLAHWDEAKEIAHNQALRQTQRAAFYANIFDYLSGNGIRGDYFEFGCHRCRTFRMALSMARIHNMHEMRFLAFDSFKGLPAPESSPELDVWKGGALATSEDEFLRLVNEHGLYTDNVRTVPGFYSESLTPELREKLLAKGRKIALVTVDCDLYESAEDVFAFMDPFLQEGSAVYIDDLFAGYRGSPSKGVGKAFREYMSTSSWRFEHHLSVGWWGRSHVCCAAAETRPAAAR